ASSVLEAKPGGAGLHCLACRSVDSVKLLIYTGDRIHDPCRRIDRDICKDSPELANRRNKSGGGIDDHEIAWVGWRLARGRTVKDARGRVVLEAAHAVIIPGGIMQRTDRRKRGAGG